jgi:hypothetical protein
MISNDEHRKLKTRLTRAVNGGDPYKILATVRAAREQFEREGFPDDWPRWRNAASDLEWNRLDGGYPDFEVQDAARQEEDCWF